MAFDYLGGIGWEAIRTREEALREAAEAALGAIPGVTIHGRGAARRASIVSFTLEGVHPHDISAILDRSGVAVRAGHHCAQPLHDRLGVHASARASFYLYNTPEEVDVLVDALHQAQEIFTI